MSEQIMEALRKASDNGLLAWNTVQALRPYIDAGLKAEGETLRRWQGVVTQAMSCIRGETPEDSSFGEAEDDTYQKLRDLDGEIERAIILAQSSPREAK